MQPFVSNNIGFDVIPDVHNKRLVIEFGNELCKQTIIDSREVLLD